MAQHRPRRSTSRTNGRCARSSLRKKPAEYPSMLACSSKAPVKALARDAPNDASADFSKSVSPVRRLNLASRQTKRGSPSSISERGSRPSFRASEKRSSAFADGEFTASSVHHPGQAASIAESPNPRLCSDDLSLFASFANRLPLRLSLSGNVSQSVNYAHNCIRVHL